MEITINSQVLAWALKDMRVSQHELAARLKINEEEVEGWLKGRLQPNKTQLTKIAVFLNKPIPIFFLKEPPEVRHPATKFRHPIGAGRTKLNSKELRFLRDATALQKKMSWLSSELDIPKPSLQLFTESDLPGKAGNEIRKQLKVTFPQQLQFASPSVSFKRWREAVERLGVFVLLYPLGPKSARGFSVWDEHAPIIAINTHWNTEARTFTLLHELGHLVTRSSSTCLNPSSHLFSSKYDSIEKWCEEFASAVLIPGKPLKQFLRLDLRLGSEPKVRDLNVAKKIASRLHVSLRATVIKLIKLGVSESDLYDQIPPYQDNKAGGGGGHGRVRSEIARDKVGRRAIGLYINALDQQLITSADVVSQLRIYNSDLERLDEIVGG